jgi:hypothetical protein
VLNTLYGRDPFQIKGVDLPLFPSYLGWLETVIDVTMSDQKDTFSNRKVIRAYLTKRVQSVVATLKRLGLVKIYKRTRYSN